MRLSLGSLLVLLTAGPLLADDAAPPWEKEVYYVAQVVNLADWPDHAFFIYPLGNPERKDSVLRLDRSGEVRYTLHASPGQPLSRPHLYALPKRSVPYPDRLPDYRELRDMRQDILRSDQALVAHSSPLLPLTEENDTLVARYRVERAGGDVLRLVLVDQTMVPRNSLPGEEDLSPSRWWPYGLGLVVLLAAVAALLWWARKRIVPK